MPIAQIFQLFFVLILIPFAIVPTVGGVLLHWGLRWAGSADVRLSRCWKVYLAASCYGYLVLLVLTYLMQGSGLGKGTVAILQVGVFLLIQLVVTPLLMRQFTRRALAAEGAAVVATNLALLALVYVQAAA